jgi:hypothetical protein
VHEEEVYELVVCVWGCDEDEAIDMADCVILFYFYIFWNVVVGANGLTKIPLMMYVMAALAKLDISTLVARTSIYLLRISHRQAHPSINHHPPNP